MLAVSNPDPLPMFFGIVLVFGLAMASLIWHFNRSETLLDRWAARNGYKILNKEYRWMARGPYWWRTGKGQSVFHVIVEDPTGYVRTGYVRVGGWFLGLLSDVADVKWDGDPHGFPVIPTRRE